MMLAINEVVNDPICAEELEFKMISTFTLIYEHIWISLFLLSVQNQPY